MAYLILSTYPGKGSRNSGDHLISKSLKDLLIAVKGKQIDIDIYSVVDHEVKDVPDLSKYTAILSPAMRPTLEGDVIAPKNRYAFLKEAEKRSIPVFAIGAGWGAYPGTIKQSTSLKMNSEDREQLISIFGETSHGNKRGVISARDITTENLLHYNGVQCYGTTGDCALFDTDCLMTRHNLPRKMDNIALSLPHNKDHWDMSYSLALQLKQAFNCEVFMTLHGYRGSFGKHIPPHWDQTQVNIKEFAGSSEKFDFYHHMDAHIGFRLHAHIWFLRTRKPSLLIAEDGRGLGHLATLNGLGYAAPSTNSLNKADQLITLSADVIADMRKEQPSFKAVEMFKQEMMQGYPVTSHSLNLIDKLWLTKMKPLLEQIP
ncbi:polysaccharide pyruvyl transferase family protein [Halobacillus sp. A1]|uniref:polysaccharide pyruvyl transferase family protein n=1 Tax=Halobacillus sp. A1 TaxID=2880262 RepID=UPI0020A645DC|nr:polysaccharide pyruvyl transferase family protein [Halobacillus sp. A1]MCP3029944.1 polysaccharide pyruvyl transferase family protein [Halobacillus sp. A1]